MTTQTLDELLSSGGKAAKFDQPGDTITGTITAVETRQNRDFDTGKPATWEDGSPQMQICVHLDTQLRDPSIEDDDGARTVYIKGWGDQLRGFRAAVKQAGGKPEPGDTFTATFTGFGPKGPRGGFPPKQYEYTLTKRTGMDAILGNQPTMPQTPVNVTHLPETPAPVQQPATPAPAIDSPADKARQLLALGLTDDQVATATGLDKSVITILRG